MKNNYKLSFVLIFAVSTMLFSCQQNKNTYNAETFYTTTLNGIIPKPNKINLNPDFKTPEDSVFILSRSTTIETKDEKFATITSFLTDFVGLDSLCKNPSSPIILKRMDNLDDEAYQILIQSKQIIIGANSSSGIFYAFETLLQIMPNKWDDGALLLPVCQIDDQPRFKYRGMHLDVCRHFYSVDFVKKYIDIMARYKLNTFHWHLTEDQGWRIEIKKYPKLTSIGAWRTLEDGSRYGGFYTQEEIKDVVAYAASRHITIIPEIEMPGHSRAALAAYPQLSCTGEALPVANKWGVFKEVYCAGNDSVFIFLEDVLDEVIDLFPGIYIHIGGDECPKESWKKCAKCQARIKANGLANEHELQSYFIKRIEKYLTSKGRKLIGWDEILEGGLAPEATVMSWRGIDGGIAAAKQHHDVIMTPGSHCYFDHYQADPAYEPKAIGGYTSLKKVYEYEPVPEALTEEESKYILGAQANLWTEYIATEDYLEYMLLPRMLALAEVNWTLPENKSWEDFQQRLNHHYAWMLTQGINFCKGDYKIHFNWVADGTSKDSLLNMTSEIYHADIRYIKNGKDSLKYSLPISIEKGDSIDAYIINGDKNPPTHYHFSR